MNLKWTIALGLIITLSFSTIAQSQDSAIYVVLKALTADEPSVSPPVKDLLISGEWEALAYWEMGTPKELTSLNEAVGDLYTFNDDFTFLMKLIDPNDSHQIGTRISGKYRIEDRIITMIAKNGKSMDAEIRFLDRLYLILEMDGLRIFFTKSKSYFSYD
jgi:hypothetical protein